MGQRLGIDRVQPSVSSLSIGKNIKTSQDTVISALVKEAVSSEDNPEVNSTSEEETGSNEYENGLKVRSHRESNGMVGDKRSSVSSPSESSTGSDRILKFDGFHLFLSDDDDTKKNSMSYKDYDVTGPSHDNPFPWTNVKATQCDIKDTSTQGIQTDSRSDDIHLCVQCTKKLNGEKGTSWKKLFNRPTRSQSVDPRDGNTTVSAKQRHGRARSQPAIATYEDDIPENLESEPDTIGKAVGHNFRFSGDFVPSPVTNSDSDEDINLGEPIPLQGKRGRRSAIAPGLTNDAGGQFLIEPTQLSNTNGSESDGRRSLRDGSTTSRASDQYETMRYMNQRFEDNLSDLNQIIKSKDVRKSKSKKRPTNKGKTRAELEEALKRYTIYDKEELEFAKYGQENMDWVTFMKDVLHTNHIPMPPSNECKRRNKIWELFRSEIVYLVDHILVLKNEFQGSLLFLISDENTFENIEPRKVFANLDEICSVSTAFCRELYKGLRETTTSEIFGPTEVIVRLLEKFETQISPAYQTYCMNYDSGAVEYLKKNEEQADFRTFLELREKTCSKSRLGIKDYLAAPIQRITKYPLLLKEIRDNTPENNAKNHLSAVIANVSKAINNLESKVKWLAKFERLKELEEMIIWPQPEAIEGRNAVTEFLRTVLAENTQMPNQMLFGSNKRNLASEGPLQMMESNKFVDVYILLFEDLLLLTKISKKKEKRLSTAGISSYPRTSDPVIPRPADCSLNVYKQPIPLDRITILDMDQEQGVDLGVKNIFAIVQFSRYGQATGVTVLAAQTNNIKNQWIKVIESTKDKCIQSHKDSSREKDSNDKKSRKEM